MNLTLLLQVCRLIHSAVVGDAAAGFLLSPVPPCPPRPGVAGCGVGGGARPHPGRHQEGY